MRVDTTVLGCTPEEAQEKPYIASMGIYVFKRSVLMELLNKNPQDMDFGGEVIPRAAKEGLSVKVRNSDALSTRPMPPQTLESETLGPRRTCSTATGRTSARSSRSSTPTWRSRTTPRASSFSTPRGPSSPRRATCRPPW